MGNYLYNGVLLPDINTVWTDKTAYPNAYIYESTFEGGKHYCLVVVDKTGYMGMYGSNHEFGPSYTLGAYELYESEEKTLTYCEWIIAADEDAASKLSGLWPGITSTEWLQVQKHYSNIKASTGNGIIWSNHKILNEDGSTYVEASEPVKKFDLKSWLTGFALGLAGKPLPFAPAQKEPTGYLYNGVQLPPLPEWDKAKYPYAFISNVKHATYQYSVYFSSSKWSKTGATFKAATDVVSYKYYFCHVNASEVVWRDGYTYENSNASTAAIADALVWANFDVLNADGSVYLAANDPVPIYE